MVLLGCSLFFCWFLAVCCLFVVIWFCLVFIVFNTFCNVFVICSMHLVSCLHWRCPGGVSGGHGDGSGGPGDVFGPSGGPGGGSGGPGGVSGGVSFRWPW